MATSISQGPSGLGLHADLMAVDKEFPGWHCWTSDAGTIYATHIRSRSEMTIIEGIRGLHSGSGVTLDAPTPLMMRQAIACYAADVRTWWAA
ncbi:MAG TPA: hypothetical protein VIL16_19625 [Trebonia sp.]